MRLKGFSYLFLATSLVFAMPLWAEAAKPAEKPEKKKETSLDPMAEAKKALAEKEKEAKSALKKREDAAKGGEKKKKVKKEKGDPLDDKKNAVVERVVNLPKFRVPVVQDRELKTYYLVELAIECDDEKAADKVFRNRPRLVDALITDLYSVFGVLWSPDFHVDLDDLKKRLSKVCSQVLGEELFEKVLVQKFMSTTQ